jgi:hypothetical protein
MTAKEMLKYYMAELAAIGPDGTQRPQSDDTYREICRLRAAAFLEHVAAMEIPQDLKEWAAIMQARYGEQIQLHHVVYSSWLVALMVVRYGEELSYWPEAFTTDDIYRARRWEWEGKTPNGVKYISPSLMRLDKSFRVIAGSLAGLCALGFLLFGQDSMWLWTIPFILFGTAASDYLENKIVDHIFRTSSYTKPTTLAVALYTAAPGETGGGTEVTGGSYARVSNNPLNTNWNATQGGTSGDSSGTGGLTANAGILTFPTPSANWGSITHFAILDNTSGGNFIIYGALTTPKTVNNGDPAPTFAAAALTVTVA